MLRKQKLVDKVEGILRDAKFEVRRYQNLCFDLVGKRKKTILLLKVLFNIDSLQYDQAIGLKSLGKILNAFSYVIGETTRFELLKDNIIYERFNIPVVTPRTFENIVQEKYPYLWRDRGGLFAIIDPVKLKRARKRAKMSRAKLAKLVGTTKKNIYEHERKEFRASLELVERIEKVLKTSIRKEFTYIWKAMDISEKISDHEELDIINFLRKIGFQAMITPKAPTDIVIKERFVALGEIAENERSKRKIFDFKNFVEFLEELAFIISSEKLDISLDIPIVSKDELLRNVKKPADLFRMIK